MKKRKLLQVLAREVQMLHIAIRDCERAEDALEAAKAGVPDPDDRRQAQALQDKMAASLFRPGLYRYDGTGFRPVEEPALVDDAFQPGLYRYDGTGFEPVEELELVEHERSLREGVQVERDRWRAIGKEVRAILKAGPEDTLKAAALGWVERYANLEQQRRHDTDVLKRHAKLLKADIDERDARIAGLKKDCAELLASSDEGRDETRRLREELAGTRKVQQELEEGWIAMEQQRNDLKDANDGLKRDLQVVKDEVSRLTSANAARCEQASQAEEQVRELEEECGKWRKRSAEALAGQVRAQERVRELEEELHEKRLHWIPGPNVSAKGKEPMLSVGSTFTPPDCGLDGSSSFADEEGPPSPPRFEASLVRDPAGTAVGWQVWDRTKQEVKACWHENAQRTLAEAEGMARDDANRLNGEDE